MYENHIVNHISIFIEINFGLSTSAQFIYLMNLQMSFTLHRQLKKAQIKFFLRTQTTGYNTKPQGAHLNFV